MFLVLPLFKHTHTHTAVQDLTLVWPPPPPPSFLFLFAWLEFYMLSGEKTLFFGCFFPASVFGELYVFCSCLSLFSFLFIRRCCVCAEFGVGEEK